MRSSFKVVSRFAGSQVSIVQGGKHIKINLDHATADQLKMLHKMGHPSVQMEEKAPPKKKTSAKDKETKGGGE